MKLRYCFNLTATPDFSEITNLEELDLEGCVNIVTVHPSIVMLKRLVVLNMRDCRRALNLSGCLNVNQLPEAFSSRWWTSIPGFIWNQQHPQRSVSLAGLHMLKRLNLSYCNLEQVPESIGSLSCLKSLYLNGNNFTSLPGSLSQLSSLTRFHVIGCKKLEVLPELPGSLYDLYASDCTSLIEVTGSSNTLRRRINVFRNCPKLFKNVTSDSDGSILKTRCLDSFITSQGFIHSLSAFREYLGFKTNRCEFFLQDFYDCDLHIAYRGKSMSKWFTNRSCTGNVVKIELPSDWCYDKFRGYGTCVVFKCKKPLKPVKGISVKTFYGGKLNPFDTIPSVINGYFEKEVIGIQDSYITWLHYTKREILGWRKAKNFVTFSFFENEDAVEVKECGVRLVYDEDLQQQDVTYLSMSQDIATPSQHGGAMYFSGPCGSISWSW
ncbi:Leucine-rich repeat-containing protein [Artemisia annua]|uniref:Leucine-rich repeat-containing protein n=1 Tax=Artemisia annua TaxID=35608 RepID=A0A2U1MEB3_ARTAN|nr:Leucine-rich repeat-containing protein [Artemisia annua]